MTRASSASSLSPSLIARAPGLFPPSPYAAAAPFSAPFSASAAHSASAPSPHKPTKPGAEYALASAASRAAVAVAKTRRIQLLLRSYGGPNGGGPASPRPYLTEARAQALLQAEAQQAKAQQQQQQQQQQQAAAAAAAAAAAGGGAREHGREQ